MLLTLDSDIAVKVIEQMARAPSADSDEVPSDAGMFAEPSNVLNWMESDFLQPPTAESSNWAAKEEVVDGEDPALSDSIQKMRDFLSDNAAFEWLKQRVQAVMLNNGGNDVTALSKKLLSILKQGYSAANEQNFTYTLDWDPREFIQCNYNSQVDVANVVCINSDGKTYQASIVGEHMARVWPITGPRFLEVLRNWWMHVSDGREEEPFQRTYAHHQHSALDWLSQILSLTAKSLSSGGHLLYMST